MLSVINIQTLWMLPHDFRLQLIFDKGEIKKPQNLRLLVGVSGLEPEKTGPESVVLPITPYPKIVCYPNHFRIAMQNYSFIFNWQNFCRLFLKKYLLAFGFRLKSTRGLLSEFHIIVLYINYLHEHKL